MLNDRHIVLDVRLSAIAAMLGECESFADIGSDHGRLAAFMLQSGRCKYAYLTDISAPSLEKARRLIAITGLNNKCDFLLGDGARVLEQPVEAAVIAGMGAVTIADIIDRAEGRLDGCRLILQPNINAGVLRRALSDGGWRIEDEALARDGRRIYPLIQARRGQQKLTAREEIIGPVLLNKPSPVRDAYAAFHSRVLAKAIAGAKSACDCERLKQLEAELAIWREIER